MTPKKGVRLLDDETIKKLVLGERAKHTNQGIVGAAKGEYTERRVALLALQCLGVKGVRRGTMDEDHGRGIDLVVQLCTGDVKLLQVKSARSNSSKARASATKAIRNGAEVVCVPIDMPDFEARYLIMIALSLAIPHPKTTCECTFMPSEAAKRRAWHEKKRAKLRARRERKFILRAIRHISPPPTRALMRWEDDGGRPAPDAESETESL